MPAGILPAGPASRPQAHVTPFPAPRDTAAAALVLFFVKFLLDISRPLRCGTHRRGRPCKLRLFFALLLTQNGKWVYNTMI